MNIILPYGYLHSQTSLIYRLLQQQALSPRLNSTSPLSIANTMRNANASSPTPGKYPYIATNKNYVFSQNKTEISSLSNNSHMGDFSKGIKIAVVMPTFTADNLRQILLVLSEIHRYAIWSEHYNRSQFALT